ncbi:EamA family transporter, partial [Vibrio cholerae O1]|uniref:EamA family transporter n=1 Tax=Vibrio cholerae TaxID=666 RepID=UPI001C11419A
PAAVAFFYSCGFIVLFVLTPRLNLSLNAPALNIEPVASLLLAWLLLDQSLNGRQLFGSALVVSGIIALALVHRGKRV